MSIDNNSHTPLIEWCDFCLQLDIESGSIKTSGFQIKKVPGTNLFLGLKDIDSPANDCNCPNTVSTNSDINLC